MAVQFIDSMVALEEFLRNVPTPTTGPPAWYIDLEGNNLSRQGTLSLMTVLIKPRETIHIVDVTTLGQAAFNTADTNSHTLKAILEADDIVKVFFDIRNDSDALYSHFGIRVNGIQDVQLMELASRSFNKKCVNGLSKCIEQDSRMDFSERRRWKEVKEQGRRLFAPEIGGRYSVFDDRPLMLDLIEYCAQDVRLLPVLREVYRAKLCDAWWLKIEDETKARIDLSQSSNYNGKGRHMALGPSSWTHWMPSAAERCSRTLLEGEKQTPPTTSTPGDDFEPDASSSASAPTIADTTSTHSPGVIERALATPASSEGSAVYEYDVSCDLIDHSGWSYGSDGDESPRDFTACDKECGYCGHCDY